MKKPEMKRTAIALLLLSFVIAAAPVLAGNTCETATPLTWYGYFGAALAPGEVIWFAGSGGIGDQFLLRLPNYAADFTVEVLTGGCSSPTVVAGPFSVGGDYTVPTPVPGDYFIRVTGLAGSVFYGFELLESNDACGEGVHLGIGDHYDSGFHHEDDYDWYQLDLSAGDCVQINVQARDGLNYAACNVLLMDDPNSCNSGMHGITGSPDGTIFLSNIVQDGTYALRLDVNSYYPATYPGAYRIYVDTCETVGNESIEWGGLKAIYR